MLYFLHTHYKMYQWTAYDEAGRLMIGEIKAISKNHAQIKLDRQDISYISLKRKFFVFFKKKISSIELVLFYRQLSTLIESGIPIAQTIDHLKKSQTNIILFSILSLIKKYILLGRPLSFCLKKWPQYFDSMTTELIFIGEQTGQFTQILLLIAAQKEKNYALTIKLKQSLFYPFIVALFAGLVFILMILVIVPQFSDIYKPLNGHLPFLTSLFIDFSQLLKRSVYFILVFIFFIPILFHKNHLLKQFQKKYVHAIPIFNILSKKMFIIHFSCYLSISIVSGITILDALRVISPSCLTWTDLEKMESISFIIEKGKPLHHALEHSGLFTPLAIQMIKMGEECGKLDFMLNKIVHLYEQEVNQLILRLGQLLEPLIIIILGVLIGGLVVAMYLPIFKLGTLF